MKTIFSTLIFVLLIAAFFGCSENPVASKTDDSFELPGTVQKAPLFKLGRATVDFGTDLSVADIAVDNGGDSLLTWQVPGQLPAWLNLDPTAGSVAGGGRQFTIVRPDRDGLGPGIHDTLVRFESNGGNGEVYAMLRVPTPEEPPLPQPKLFVTPPELNFGASADTLFFAIINDGTGELNFSLSENIPWASVSSLSGTAPANIAVVVDRSNLSPTSYRGDIFISSNGGNATEPVKMVVPTPEEPPLVEASFPLNDIVVRWDKVEGRVVSLGTFTVGGHTFTVVAKHGLLFPCYQAVEGSGPNSVHFFRLRVVIADGIARFFIDADYTGDEAGQRDEVFALEVNGMFLDRGDCPVVPDGSGYQGRIKDIFAGKLSL